MTAVTLYVPENSQDVIIWCESCNGNVRVVGGANNGATAMHAADRHVAECTGSETLLAELARIEFGNVA